MVPEHHICHSVRSGEIILRYLTERDHPWLRALLEEYDRFVGRPRRELDERLHEPLPCVGPRAKARVASLVLDGLYGSRGLSPIPPIKARAAVFDAASRSCFAPEVVVSEVARSLDVPPELLRESLFADMPGERRILPPARAVSPGELALRVNLALVQAILFRSTSIAIEAQGRTRPVVRHAKLRGLICSVAARGSTNDASLEISGPFSLFRRTLLYGRALAELVPLLAWCPRFRLRSECVLRGKRLSFVLGSGDPILPAQEPRLYDSSLEERFARDFRRAYPDYDLFREPEAIEAGNRLIFPDFALVRRGDPTRRWLLEIVGFWTPEYLARKLSDLRAARISNLIVCLDDDRNCGEGDFAPGSSVVRFHRRVDPTAVVRAMNTPSS